jgi:hypothetical protein
MVRGLYLRGGALDYFGADASKHDRQSALRYVAGTQVPVLLAVAEHDPGFLVHPTLEMAAELTSRDGKCPPLYRLEGHNHFSPPASLGTSDDELGSAILRFIKAKA